MSQLTSESDEVERAEPQAKAGNTVATTSSADARFQDLEARTTRLETQASILAVLEHRSVSKKDSKATKINFIDQKFDATKGKRVDQEVEDFFEDDAPTYSNPISARRVFKDDNKSVDKIDIIIEGSGLRKLLQGVLSTYLKHEFKSTFEKPEITLSQPFIPLEYNWEQLQAATTTPEILQEYGNESLEDLKTLLDLVYRLAPKNIDTWKNVKDSKTIMKRFLHSIFRPGNLVVATIRDRHVQLMKVHHFGAGSTANHNDTSSVFCEGYDWNGKTLERVRYEFPLPKMERDEQFKVRDLPCYPIEMYEDMDGVNKADELKQDLIKRGQKFEKLCMRQDEGGRKHIYEGHFQVEGDLRSGLLSNQSSRSVTLHNELSAFLRGSFVRDRNVQANLAEARDVVIDFKSFLEFGPREAKNGPYSPQFGATPCNCPLCISEKSKDWIASFGQTREQKDVDDYALLPYRALGFALNSKSWGQFSIDGIEPDVKDAYDVFMNELVFPDGKEDKNKEVLKGLITNHGNQSFSRITDFVGGKGQGLVLLFHGPPGVGKTMTAETLAKACGKILLSVGIGDLGTTAETVEQSLHKLFEVITAWHGILLIDEADIFLDSRGSKGDVYPEQNAMVSVMLRLLEYFSGILIMTTNRVRSIDYAILSRIGYAIKFPALPVASQKIIFQGFINQAKNKKGVIDQLELKKLDKLADRIKAKDNLNGRDIRTMFTTAQLRGNGKLTADAMEEILEQQTSFKDDMNTLYIVAEDRSVVR